MPGVDGFWSDSRIEPKRKFRWLLSFRGVPQWIMKKVGKPNFSLGEAEHSFLNYKFYYPGRVEWSEISMTLVDPVSPDASKTMMALLKQSGYVPPHNFLNANTIPEEAPGRGGWSRYTLCQKTPPLRMRWAERYSFSRSMRTGLGSTRSGNFTIHSSSLSVLTSLITRVTIS